MVQIIWTQESEDDLKKIIKYISKDSVTYAYRVIRKIVGRVDVLHENPSLGKVVHEFNDDSIRELIEGQYRIIYRLKSKTEIQILTVHHSARNLAKRKLT